MCPLILLFLLTSPDTGHILSFGILILGGALLLLYLKESLMLFLSKKISILHWFCTFVPSKFSRELRVALADKNLITR